MFLFFSISECHTNRIARKLLRAKPFGPNDLYKSIDLFIFIMSFRFLYERLPNSTKPEMNIHHRKLQNIFFGFTRDALLMALSIDERHKNAIKYFE